MLKTLGRIVIILLVAGAFSGALYLIVNRFPAQTTMSVPPNGAPNWQQNPGGQTGLPGQPPSAGTNPSGAADGQTAPLNQPPAGFQREGGPEGASPLMALAGILENIGVIALVTVVLVVVKKIISRITRSSTPARA